MLAAQGKWDESFNGLEKTMQMAAYSLSIFDDTVLTLHMIRLRLIQGDLGRASRDIKAYNIENYRKELFYLLWELSQLVLYRAKTMELIKDLSITTSYIEGLTTMISEAERRQRAGYQRRQQARHGPEQSNSC